MPSRFFLKKNPPSRLSKVLEHFRKCRRAIPGSLYPRNRYTEVDATLRERRPSTKLKRPHPPTVKQMSIASGKDFG